MSPVEALFTSGPAPGTAAFAVLGGLFVLLGLTFGSFVAAAVYRMPRGIPLTGRSACTACGTTLTVPDLVPVLSWLAAGRRCRHCGAPVSARYCATEATTALIWLGCLLLLGDPAPAALVASLATLLLLAALIDLDHFYLPDGVTAAVALLALVPPAMGHVPWTTALTGALLFGGTALAVRAAVTWRAGREAMGLGDVKLFAVAGLWLGPAALPAFLLLSGAGGLVLAVAVRLSAGRASPPDGRGDGGAPVPGAIPFGPALALALVLLALLPPGFWSGP